MQAQKSAPRPVRNRFLLQGATNRKLGTCAAPAPAKSEKPPIAQDRGTLVSGVRRHVLTIRNF